MQRLGPCATLGWGLQPLFRTGVSEISSRKVVIKCRFLVPYPLTVVMSGLVILMHSEFGNYGLRIFSHDGHTTKGVILPKGLLITICLLITNPFIQ